MSDVGMAMPVRIAKHLAYDVPKDIACRLYGKGFSRICNEVATIKGLQAVTKSNETFLPWIQEAARTSEVLQAVDFSLGETIASNSLMCAFIYGTGWLDALNQFIAKNGRFQLPAKNPLTLSLLLAGASCNGLDYLYSLQLLPGREFFALASSQIGGFKVFSYAVINIPVLRCLALKPKDFFIVFACISMSWDVIKAGNERRAKGADFIEAYLQTDDLLKHAGNLGKVVLISVGFMYGGAYGIKLTGRIVAFVQVTAFGIKDTRSELFAKPALPGLLMV